MGSKEEINKALRGQASCAAVSMQPRLAADLSQKDQAQKALPCSAHSQLAQFPCTGDAKSCYENCTLGDLVQTCILTAPLPVYGALSRLSDMILEDGHH